MPSRRTRVQSDSSSYLSRGGSLASLTETASVLITDDWHIHGSIYRDPLIFEREINTIFAREWIYVGHESEVSEGGSYKTAYIGRQPVIVTRSADDFEIN